MARYLQRSDLEDCVGVDRVIKYFDDDMDGAVSSVSELAALDNAMTAAENEADSRLKRSFSDDQITRLAETDTAFRRHIAFIALTFATERKPEFLSVEGKSQFAEQYERAIKYVESLSKGRSRSFGESAAGKSARLGGVVNPPTRPGEPRFVFAKDKNAPTGHGGF